MDFLASDRIEMRFYAVTALSASEYLNGEWETYPPDLFALHSGAEVPAPIRVRIVAGSENGDLLFSTPNVVSRKFLGVLMENRASGFSFAAVPVMRSEIEVDEFYCLMITGRGGQFDELRSGAYRMGSALFGHEAVFMEEDGWDGSDLFLIPGLGIRLFVTERIGDALKRADLANVRLILNSEHSFGVSQPPG